MKVVMNREASKTAHSMCIYQMAHVKLAFIFTDPSSAQASKTSIQIDPADLHYSQQNYSSQVQNEKKIQVGKSMGWKNDPAKMVPDGGGL
jgi:hypothetical protein